jgi:predicted nucleotidyltransferase
MDRFEELRERVLPFLLPYVKRVAVFGSFARDEVSPESDLDLLVELRPPNERPPVGLKWFGLEQELSQLLGREVELVTESALSPYIRPYVEKEKVVLYEEG